LSGAGGCASLLALTLLAGCSSDDETATDSTLADTGQVRTVAVPPERQTPFCQAFAELDERIADLPEGADAGELIIDTYASIVDDVPPEIRDDFLTVLAALQAAATEGSVAASSTSTSTTTTTAAPVTTLEDFEEGYTPDDSPALRLNAYVQFACRDGQNNPGPPDTEPLPPPLTSEPG
jgi:hypothetical protein